ncbi:MAG: hypothetical protein KDD47_05595 [Acidobacteria bacterium]|nr:hypothetical protein [Acidobacteriota bacterium]
MNFLRLLLSCTALWLGGTIPGVAEPLAEAPRSFSDEEIERIVVVIDFSLESSGLGDDRYAFVRTFVPQTKALTKSGAPSVTSRIRLSDGEASQGIGTANQELWQDFHDDRSGSYAFRIGGSVFDDSGDRRLATLVVDGWEFNPVALAIWKRAGEGWLLEGLGRTLLMAGISKVEILEWRPLDDHASIVVGRTRGGDGGEMWSALWVGRWIQKDDLEIVYQTAEVVDEGGLPGGWSLDPELVLTVEEAQGVCPGEAETARVAIRPILEAMNAGKTVLEAQRQLGIFDPRRDLRARLSCSDLDEHSRNLIHRYLELPD